MNAGIQVNGDIRVSWRQHETNALDPLLAKDQIGMVGSLKPVPGIGSMHARIMQSTWVDGLFIRFSALSPVDIAPTDPLWMTQQGVRNSLRVNHAPIVALNACTACLLNRHTISSCTAIVQ